MSKHTGETYQAVQLGKEIDVLKGRIVKLQDRVDALTQENSRLQEMLSVYETKKNRDLIKRLNNELIRK